MATRSPVRGGFSEAREGSTLFYNVKVKGGKDVHAVERYMKIAGALGCDEQNIIFPFSLCSGEMRSIEAIKRDLKDYAVIVPGARWDTKIWAAGNFGRIASLLPLKSIRVGSRRETGYGQKGD